MTMRIMECGWCWGSEDGEEVRETVWEDRQEYAAKWFLQVVSIADASWKGLHAQISAQQYYMPVVKIAGEYGSRSVWSQYPCLRNVVLFQGCFQLALFPGPWASNKNWGTRLVFNWPKNPSQAIAFQVRWWCWYRCGSGAPKSEPSFHVELIKAGGVCGPGCRVRDGVWQAILSMLKRIVKKGKIPRWL